MKTRTQQKSILGSVFTLGFLLIFSLNSSAYANVINNDDGNQAITKVKHVDGDHFYEMKCDGKSTEAKTKESKCGDAKSNDMKSGKAVKSDKKAKTSEGKCGDAKSKDMKSSKAVKSEKKAKTSEGKCGEGKCGEGKCGVS